MSQITQETVRGKLEDRSDCLFEHRESPLLCQGVLPCVRLVQGGQHPLRRYKQGCGSRHLQETPFRSIPTILPSLLDPITPPSVTGCPQHSPRILPYALPTHPQCFHPALTAHLFTLSLVGQPGPNPPQCQQEEFGSPPQLSLFSGLTALRHRRDALGTLCCSKAPPGHLCQWVPWVADVGQWSCKSWCFPGNISTA